MRGQGFGHPHPGPARLRSAAVIRLLLHNALRVDEALGADIADLGTDRGHQVLTVLGKGNRRAKVALTSNSERRRSTRRCSSPLGAQQLAVRPG